MKSSEAIKPSVMSANNNVVKLSDYQPNYYMTGPAPRQGFNYEDYNLRANARCRRKNICSIITAVSEAIVTIAIGLVFILGIVLYFG